nr:uncharacterized protein LOC127328393 [Lolium perenne]
MLLLVSRARGPPPVNAAASRARPQPAPPQQLEIPPPTCSSGHAAAAIPADADHQSGCAEVRGRGGGRGGRQLCLNSSVRGVNELSASLSSPTRGDASLLNPLPSPSPRLVSRRPGRRSPPHLAGHLPPHPCSSRVELLAAAAVHPSPPRHQTQPPPATSPRLPSSSTSSGHRAPALHLAAQARAPVGLASFSSLKTPSTKSGAASTTRAAVRASPSSATDGVATRMTPTLLCCASS